MTQPVSVAVTGGADGITANLDDLANFAGLVRSGADSVAEALDQLTGFTLRLMLEVGADEDPAGAATVRADLAALAGPSGQLHAVQDRLRSLWFLLSLAVRCYHDGDRSVLGSITHAFGDLVLGTARVMGGDYTGGGRALFAALPGLTDATMLFAGGLEGPYSETVPDGHAVLHDLGIDTGPAATLPPRCLADLIGGLAARNSGRAGEISVSFVVGGDGRRRAIVDIPGTKSWNPMPNHNVTSVGTDIRALDGRSTAYEDGVFLALDSAGVSKDDQVMLVGHSEGGIVAVDAARHAARSGRFTITHVITAGSPIGRISRDLPKSVQVLALENSADVVPEFDAAANPDRPNITTVTVDEQNYSIGANHDLATTYQSAARSADLSCNASIDAFVQSADGFLDSATMRTHAYRITRGLS